ncbi:AMED_5909 family protein [Amycolatopsis jejuensis]|uniref:AMED_5909 family protein n=1 Tax=Amycolatopsis jejuensis TaxID=330084 RepID=UPI000524113C|nr:AMED_5909 family protein [Amycolatopsis jejuensis]
MAKGEPKTLLDAHEVVLDRRPTSGANPSAWRAFRLGNARLYKAVADLDRTHHHEALYWAGYEERRAGEISAQPEAEGKPAD